MTNYKPFRFNASAFWLTACLLLLAMICFTSCSSLRKLKTNVQQSVKVDSTSSSSKKVDSSATKIIKKVDSSGTTITVTFDSTGNDSATTVEIETYPPKKEDYLQPGNTGTGFKIKTNRMPKSIEVNQQQKQSNEQNQTTTVSGTEAKETKVTKAETIKKTEVNKSRFTFHWWWLLIILALLLIFLWLRYNLTPVGLFQKFVSWLGTADKKSFNQNNNMKNLILLCLLSTSLFIGCGVAPDKNNTKVEERQSLMRPDNPLDWEYIYVDSIGKYAVLKQVNGKGTWVQIDTTFKVQKKIAKSVFWIQMSSRHVKQFMQFSDYFPKQALPGMVLIVAFLSVTIYTLWKNGWHISGLSFGAACAFVFTLGWFIWMIQHTPADLSDNNRKQLSRAEYEYWMKKDPTFDSYWFEKWERNELTGLYNKDAVK